MDRTDTVG
jgi:hypothetical protein